MISEDYLVLVGPSGTGKTVLMNNLIKDYPSKFFKVNQVTTRDIRDDEVGDAYLWLNSKRDYKKLEHLLIGKTQIFDTHYGSIPEGRDGMVGIIILNEMGLVDFMKTVNKSNGSLGYFVLGLNRDLDSITVKREGRDEEYVLAERKVLDYADQVVHFKNNQYATTEEIFKMVKGVFFEGRL